MDTSIIKQLEASFRKNWDKPALTDYEVDITYTYGQIATRIRYIHFLFEELNILPGDKVAICSKNCTNWAISMLAIITYRAVAVPLLADYSNKQIIDLSEHCDAKFMIGDKRLKNLWPEGECPMYLLDIEDLLTMNPDIHTDNIEKRAFFKFRKLYGEEYTRDNVSYEDTNPDDLMLLSYTSGSTGRPKGVMLSAQAMWSNLEFAKDAIKDCDNIDSTFAILPMAHMFGFSFDFIIAMTSGFHLYVLTKVPVPKVLVEAFQKVRPAIFLCVPLVMEKIINGKVLPILNTPKMKFMLKVPGLRQIICRKVRKTLIDVFGGNLYEVIMGGAALSKEVEKVLQMIKFPYTVGYGMTECGPIITFADKKIFKQGTCGRVVQRMTVKVLSDDPQNTPGEIVAKGTNVMMGYYKNQEATDESIDSEGWLHTGDLGVIDKDGNLIIRGRKKNMLLGSNGQNIYPEEAEDQVVSHSIFDECVVVQREGKLVGLVYAADMTLKINRTTREALNLEAIRKEVNSFLPNYCQLSKLEQRSEEFEKTPKKSIRRFLYK